jgi:hypothetical protein
MLLPRLVEIQLDSQLSGSCRSEQSADQADTRKRWAGSVQESVGPNIRSWSTKCCAYAQ